MKDDTHTHTHARLFGNKHMCIHTNKQLNITTYIITNGNRTTT